MVRRDEPLAELVRVDDRAYCDKEQIGKGNPGTRRAGPLRMKAKEPVIMSKRNAASVQMIDGGSIPNMPAFCQSKNQATATCVRQGKKEGKEKHEAEAEAEESVGRGWKRRDATRVREDTTCRHNRH